MTPDQLAKSGTEHAHQTALFAYCAVARQKGFDSADMWASSGNLLKTALDKQLYALEWLHAIPNGGSRGDNAKSRAIRGGQLKAEGVKSGVADCFLPFPVGQWHGLYIEMKKPSQKPKTKGKGGMSDKQIKFKNYCLRVGYGHVVCYSWKEAKESLKQYIEWKE